jgi:hypothetical protein
MKQITPFFEKLPYQERTAFGQAILFDPRRHIRETIFTEDSGIPCMGLDEGEKIVLDYLIRGRSYATTGTRFNMVYYILIQYTTLQRSPPTHKIWAWTIIYLYLNLVHLV